ncbi:BTAD domain-containing putative transcriptional regulator, partial [Kitasatospora sp. NPDC058965]|uniref:AfsR/SARP family transcriptional regulator n=1 Tax=Kitasatospora sp. NPDC058965 TaxID=3346682 RepID=UPI0036A96B53
MDPGGAAGGLRYELLGPLRVSRGRQVLEAGPAMQRAVLAVLLLAGGEPVAREQIVQGVWGSRAGANAPALVTTYVSRLRRVLDPDRPRRSLGGVLATRGTAYRLAPGELDLHAFEAARSRARAEQAAGSPAQAARTLEQALALWRGAGLDGLPGPFAALHRARLVELRLAAQEEYWELALRLGRHHEAVPELRLLLAAQPLRERLCALLMLALHRAGRPGEALAAYGRLRQQLIGAQGMEPGRELAELQARILRADPELAPPAAQPPVVPPAVALRVLCLPAQLPSDLPDFTGRSAQLRVLGRLFGGARRAAAVPVAVVSGEPGVGKTALAVHAAHRLRAHYPDGQLVAGLHGADGRPVAAGELLHRLLTDLGVEPGELPAEPERRAALFRSVSSGRRLLLVLDDAADEAQVAPLLPGSASCAVLVTARGRLAGLPGARAVRLDRLAPAEAGRLWHRLLAEAQATGPADRRDEEAVLAACAGLPLALR